MFKLNEIIQATSGRLVQGKSKGVTFSGISIDTRTIKRNELFLAIKGNNFDGHNFIKKAVKKGAKGIIFSKGRKLPLPFDIAAIRVKDTTLALGDIANFHRRRINIPLVAITGSNGKTTTKDMLSSVLKKRYKVLNSIGTNNNQIGVPLTLLKLKPFHEIAVLELGTNHSGEIDYLRKICQPNIAIITNIGPSHLEFFKKLDNVFKEKYSLLKALNKKGIAIINNDDKYLSRISRAKTKYKVISFGIREESDFKAEKIELKNGRFSFFIKAKYPIELKTLGFHNIYNCLAAIACCKYLGLDYNCIQKQIKKFSFPARRLEVKDFKNIKVIDDTYNANPLSLKNAIDALSGFGSFGRKVLICADMLELGKSAEEFHLSLGKYAADSGVDVMIGVGRLAKLFCDAALMSGMKKDAVFHFAATESAVKLIPGIIRARDVILVKGSRLMRMETIVETLKKAALK